MGPTFGLIVLLLGVIAGGMLVTLWLMRGWKAVLVLIAIYATVLLWLGLAPPYEYGMMDRALLGLGWIGLAVAALLRFAVPVMQQRARNRSSV